MISTTRINFELLRCIDVRYKLTELFLDATLWGMGNRIYRSAKDIFTLYALQKALYNAVYYEYTETEVETVIYKIREYLGMFGFVSKVDYFLSLYPNINCPSQPGEDSPYVEPGDGDGDIINITNITNQLFYPTTYVTNTTTITDDTEWHQQNLTPLITVDGQTTITGLNFNVSNIDIDSIRLEVQGDDTVYQTTGEGYHIVGNTLYWHHFYDLKVGMQVAIKWREE